MYGVKAVAKLEESRHSGFSYLRTISLLTILTFLSKFVGVFRETLIAWNFGDGTPVAALSLATGISNTVFGVLTATVSVAALPLYAEIKAKASPKQAQEFLSNLLVLLLLGAAGLMVFFWVGAEPLARLFAGGLPKDAFDLTVQMLRITLFSVYFQLASAILTVFLQSERRLVQIMLANMSFNIAHISCTLLAVRYGPTWLARSAVLGAVLTSSLLVLMARHYGFRWRIHIDFKDPMLRRIVIIMLPVWLGMSIGTLNIMVDRTMATYLGTESVAAIEWAQKTLGSAASFFVPTITMIIAPLFAESAVRGIQYLLDAFRKSLCYIIILLVPLAFGAMLVAENAIGVILGYGAFGSDAVHRTMLAMVFYAPNSLLLGVVNDSVYRFFVAQQETFIPMRNGVVALIVSIILNLLLAPRMGVAGLALATSMATLLCITLGVRQMRIRHGAIGGRQLLRSTMWAVGASLFMSLPVISIGIFVVPSLILRWHRVLVLIAQVLSGAACYFLVINQSKLPEVEELKSLLFKRNRKTPATTLPPM